MTTQSVEYVTCTRICCNGSIPADVILCLDATVVAPHLCITGDSQSGTTSFIEAVLSCESCEVGVCNKKTWRYVFTYDDAQLVDGVVLNGTYITGVFCESCFTQWVRQLVGDDPYVYSEPYGDQIFVSPHGCLYPICGTRVADTYSVNLTLTNDDDPYCPTLVADVNISEEDNNCLELLEDGLFVECGGEGGDAWLLLGNSGTVDGTNFIGTLDNVAHDVRVNNIRCRRSEPNDVCANIIDGGPDADTGSLGIVKGCTIGGGGADPFAFIVQPHIIDAGFFSTIGGGATNFMIPDAIPNVGDFAGGYSTIGGGLNNFIQMDRPPWLASPFPPLDELGFQGSNTIGGGTSNGITSSDYNVIPGGFGNVIDYSVSGGTQLVQDYVWGDVIGGGVENFIGNAPLAGSPAIEDLGFNVISGGHDTNITNCLACVVGGGESNIIDDFTAALRGPFSYNVISGGLAGTLSGGTRSSIHGGGINTLEKNDSSTIVGGYINRITNTANVDLVQTLVGANTTDPEAVAGLANAIIGGVANEIANGFCSTILGGAFLKIGANSCGYQNPGTRSFTGVNGAARNVDTDRSEAIQVDVSAFSNISYWGDTDLWIANTDSTARKLKLFEPNADADFSSSHYTSFQAQAQAANIEYVMPAATGVAGQALTIQSVVGNVVTLEWA